MKKITYILFVTVAFFAISCKEDDNVSPSGGGKGKTKLELKIDIDGQFSDWAATDSRAYAAAENDPNSPWDAVEEIRCCSDGDYVYYYIRFDQDSLNELFSLKDEMPIRLNINTDGEFESGYLNYSLQGYDFIIEGDLSDKAGAWAAFEGVLYQRIDSKWETLLEKSEGVATGAGAGCEYEIMVDRGIFSIGVSKSSQPNSSIGEVFQTGIRFYETTIKKPGSWEELSNMPNSDIDDDGTGWGELLEVTTIY